LKPRDLQRRNLQPRDMQRRNLQPRNMQHRSLQPRDLQRHIKMMGMTHYALATSDVTSSHHERGRTMPTEHAQPKMKMR